MLVSISARFLTAGELSAHDRLERPEHGLVVSNAEGGDPSCQKKRGSSYPTHDGGTNGETIRETRAASDCAFASLAYSKVWTSPPFTRRDLARQLRERVEKEGSRFPG